MTTRASDFWFPGRWIGGVALVAAPLCLLAGVLLRAPFHFFFPDQLAAVADHPLLMASAYGAFFAGNVMLWPAVLTMARMIGVERPAWGLAGGALVMFGLFARAFHAGADYLAFQLVRVQGAEAATAIVADSYAAYHVASALNPAILFGWTVLAVGAYRAGVLGPFRSLALTSMSALMIGRLKGTTMTSIVVTAGLAVALVPVGLSLLTAPPRPSGRQIAMWIAITVLGLLAFVLLGMAG